MPYKTTKVKGGYRTVNKDTGRVMAKHSSKGNAEDQKQLLAAIKHNPNFKPRKK